MKLVILFFSSVLSSVPGLSFRDICQQQPWVQLVVAGDELDNFPHKVDDLELLYFTSTNDTSTLELRKRDSSSENLQFFDDLAKQWVKYCGSESSRSVQTASGTGMRKRLDGHMIYRSKIGSAILKSKPKHRLLPPTTHHRQKNYTQIVLSKRRVLNQQMTRDQYLALKTKINRSVQKCKLINWQNCFEEKYQNLCI